MPNYSYYYYFNKKENLYADYVHRIISLRAPVPAISSGLESLKNLERGQAILFKEGEGLLKYIHKSTNG